MKAETNNYYREVGSYYDHFSRGFIEKYEEHFILQQIRSSFRKEALPYAGQRMLEIGFGPGLDVAYFASTFPDAEIYGIDVSEGMLHTAEATLKQQGISNARLYQASVEELDALFANQPFDLIYVFFGALNTVEDLEAAAQIIRRYLSPNGHAVLTFVNKWYLKGILLPLVKGKFNTAFARLKKVWGGYSTSSFLSSKCYSIDKVKRAFSDLKLIKIRGYSILYPAWYESKKYKNGKWMERLWKMDKVIGHSIGRGFGEYSLFVFRK